MGFLQPITPGCNNILVFEENAHRSIGETGGIAHFGFRLSRPEEIEDIVSRVIEEGGTITDRGDFVPGSPYVFFKDPDGYLVEVWYEVLE